MSSYEGTPGWVRMLTTYSIWFTVVLVLRAIVLPLDGVMELGYAAVPDFRFYGSGAYPLGLLWLQVFDTAFRTVLILLLLSLGGHVRRAMQSSFPDLPQLGRTAYRAGVLGALIIGYFGYVALIAQPLVAHDAGWVYKLVFWGSVGTVIALMVYDFAQLLPPVAREVGGTKAGSRATAGGNHGASAGGMCMQCRTELPLSAAFCPACGAKTSLGRTGPGTERAGASAGVEGESQDRPVRGSGGGPDALLGTRKLRLTRSTGAGAPLEYMLQQFLKIDEEYGEYRALLVTFSTPPPESRRTRLLGVRGTQDIEGTALEFITPEELERWDRMQIGDLVVLAERRRGDREDQDASASRMGA